MSASDSNGFDRDDLDALARRAVDSVMTLVRRGLALAGGVMLMAVIFSVGGFLLGLAALDGGIEKVWIVLGGTFAILAVGNVGLAILRLRSVKKDAGTLITEVRSLIGGDRETERTVIETVESTDGRESDGVVAISREFFVLKGAVGNRIGQFKSLGLALTAITSFPALIAVTTAITLVFAGLSVIFLIALAL
ncbi:MAG: hypothetical protein ACI9N0_001647 [Ilumatobacter sp.]|jgi:hypothetical protein